MGVSGGGGAGVSPPKKKGGVRMSFLSSIKKVLNIGQTEKKRNLVLQNIKVCTLNYFTSGSILDLNIVIDLD